MIAIKSPNEIALMRRAGRITAAARKLAGEMVLPGVTTHEIDRAVLAFIRSKGGTPSFLHYNGYPAAPASRSTTSSFTASRSPAAAGGRYRKHRVGAFVDGFHGDCAAPSPAAR
jgi:methionyl aminopeptidase